MNWQKIYNDIINRSKDRGLNKKELEGYYEIHHIIPKCLGGTNDKDNLVLLTVKEHIICHLLLTRIYPNNSKLLFSVISFLQGDSNSNKIRNSSNLISLKTATFIREEWIKSLKGKPGHKHSEESKQKISKANKGKKRSDEFKKNMSDIAKNRPPMSEETRRKSSETHKRISSTEEAKRIQSERMKGWVPTEEMKLKSSLKQRGREVSKETRNKLSKAFNGKKMSEEQKRKISESSKNGNHGNLSVKSPNGTIYNSLIECEKATGISRTTIKRWATKFPEKGYEIISNSPVGDKIQGPDGTIYNSLKDCANSVNKSETTIKRWIRKFPEMGYKYYNDNNK